MIIDGSPNNSPSETVKSSLTRERGYYIKWRIKSSFFKMKDNQIALTDSLDGVNTQKVCSNVRNCLDYF